MLPDGGPRSRIRPIRPVRVSAPRTRAPRIGRIREPRGGSPAGTPSGGFETLEIRLAGVAGTPPGGFEALEIRLAGGLQGRAAMLRFEGRDFAKVCEIFENQDQNSQK